MSLNNIVFTWALVLAVVVSFIACEEVGPNINLGGINRAAELTDTTYVSSNISAPQEKRALLLDFTGVKCLNCPAATRKIKEMQTQNPDRIVAIGMYSQFLSTPYDGDPDLRTEEAEQIQDMLAPFRAKPSGAIDMADYSPNFVYLIDDIDLWPSYTEERLQLSTPVNIDIANTYDEATRELKVTVQLEYTSAHSAENRLMVAIMENGIVATQLDGTEVDEDYEHEHVLRTTLTPFNGERLDAPLEAGRIFIKEFKITLDPEWDHTSTEVVAYVHNFGNNLEAQHAAVQPIVQ